MKDSSWIVGDGIPVVLVHGSLATGAEEWEAQRPMADEAFAVVPDRGAMARARRRGGGLLA